MTLIRKLIQTQSDKQRKTFSTPSHLKKFFQRLLSGFVWRENLNRVFAKNLFPALFMDIPTNKFRSIFSRYHISAIYHGSKKLSEKFFMNLKNSFHDDDSQP